MRKERSSVIVCVTGQNGESIYVYIQSQVQSVDGQTVGAEKMLKIMRIPNLVNNLRISPILLRSNEMIIFPILLPNNSLQCFGVTY